LRQTKTTFQPPFVVTFAQLFTRVGTYVQRGSKFCFVVVLVVLVAESLVRILHFRPISPCFQPIIAPLHTSLPGILAHACPAALRTLARQPCARCCPDKFKQVQQTLRALLSRQVRTGSAEYYTILHHPTGKLIFTT
jgi:hypothetical protein